VHSVGKASCGTRTGRFGGPARARPGSPALGILRQDSGETAQVRPGAIAGPFTDVPEVVGEGQDPDVSAREQGSARRRRSRAGVGAHHVVAGVRRGAGQRGGRPVGHRRYPDGDGVLSATDPLRVRRDGGTAGPIPANPANHLINRSLGLDLP
jgi:hypothetical protein